MNKVDLIILGATGHVGRSLVNRISETYLDRYNIRALVRNPEKLINDNVTIVKGDIQNIPEELFLDRPNIIIHLATKKTNNDGLGYYSVNVDGTRNLLNKTNKNTLGIIYSSSFSVYGQNDLSRIQENQKINPETELAISRVQAENEIKNFSAPIHKFILRPRFIISANDTQTLKPLVKLYKSGLCLGNGYQESSYISAIDYADIILDIADYICNNTRSNETNVLNVGYEEPLSIRQLFDVFGKIYGKKRTLFLPVSGKLLKSLKRIKSKKWIGLLTKIELVAFSHSFQVHNLKKYIQEHRVEKMADEVIYQLLTQHEVKE